MAPTEINFARWALRPVDFELIDDFFNAVDPAECLLGHLFLEEGLHATSHDDAAVGRSFKPDFPVRNVGACF